MISDKVELLEIFKDFNIEIICEYKKPYKRKEGFKERTVRYNIVKKSDPKKVTVEDLNNYASELNKKFPDEQFVVKEELVGGKKFYVLTKLNVNSSKPTVPIYFDLEEQRFFVPKDYVVNKRDLTNYIIMRTLGALGVSTSKYGGAV